MTMRAVNLTKRLGLGHDVILSPAQELVSALVLVDRDLSAQQQCTLWRERHAGPAATSRAREQDEGQA